MERKKTYKELREEELAAKKKKDEVRKLIHQFIKKTSIVIYLKIIIYDVPKNLIFFTKTELYIFQTRLKTNKVKLKYWKEKKSTNTEKYVPLRVIHY